MSVSKKKKAGLADDDRNLVLVDGDFSDADLDDRAWLIWERYKFGILVGAAVLFVAGLGIIAWSAYSSSKSETLAAEYGEAATPESKLAFAELNRGEPIAAFAALEAADAAYAKGDYKEAANRYGRTIVIADAVSPRTRVAAVGDRALVGAAVSEIRAGNEAAGVKQLNAVIDDIRRDASVRAHALFLLAEKACGDRDFAAAKKYLDRIDTLSGATGWLAPQSPKTELIRSFPEILAVGAAPSAPATTPAAVLVRPAATAK